MNEATYRLAYDASVRAIEDQARVLESLRSRAGTMFAAAALVTSFLGGTALAGSETGIAVVIATGAFIAAALPVLVLQTGYPLPDPRGCRVGDRIVEVVMAEPNPKPRPKPEPQWPDLSKPDTRGGG